MNKQLNEWMNEQLNEQKIMNEWKKWREKMVVIKSRPNGWV